MAAAGPICGVLAILFACVVVFVFHTREYYVDDAFIGFQYLSNFLAGDGFVFHSGTAPVEGVTNIGWLLMLAPLSMFAEPTVVAKLVGLALVLLTLILTVYVGHSLAVKVAHLEDSFGLVLPPVLVLATNFDFVYFSVAGMETGLLAAILLLMACIALARPRSMLLPLLGAFSFLVHPEAVAIYPCYVALCWLQTKGGAAAGRSFVRGMLVLAVLLGVITAARFAYFHDVVPNTFHAKPSSVRLAVENGYAFLMGQNTNVGFPMTGWLALPVLLLGYRRLWRAAPDAAQMLAAICGIGLAFAIYSRADWTGLSRYFAPYLPVALILLWAGLCEAIGLFWGTATLHTKQVIAAAATLLLVLTNIVDGRAKMAHMEVYPGYVLAAKNLVGPAKWMRDALPADATIATRRIGALAYYSRHKVFDYTFGLPEPEVARLVGEHGQGFNTPTDPVLAALWRARAPDYLLEDGHVIDTIVAEAHGTPDRFSIHGIEYRVVEKFPIGFEVLWVLAKRVGP